MRSLAVPIVLALLLAGCGSVLRSGGAEPQSIVNNRVIGMTIGDFLDRYGRAATTREEAPDGSVTFNWQSPRTTLMGGPGGPEISVCRLRLSANRVGKILAALIVRDGDGVHRRSGCAELFEES
jgi:hypothetical protein